ncbi:hypothetical protein ACQUY5_18580, partial [Bacillus cereus]
NFVEEEDVESDGPEPIIEEVKLVQPIVTPPVVEKKEPVQPIQPVIEKVEPAISTPKPVLNKEVPNPSQFDISNNPRPSRTVNSNSRRIQNMEGSEEDFIKKIMNGQNSEVTSTSTVNHSPSPKVEEVKVENLPPDPISYLRLHPRSKENDVKKLYSPKVVDDYINSGIITRARGVLLI